MKRVPSWIPTAAGIIAVVGVVALLAYWLYDSLGSAIASLPGAVAKAAGSAVSKGIDTVTAPVTAAEGEAGHWYDEAAAAASSAWSYATGSTDDTGADPGMAEWSSSVLE